MMKLLKVMAYALAFIGGWMIGHYLVLAIVMVAMALGIFFVLDHKRLKELKHDNLSDE